MMYQSLERKDYPDQGRMFILGIGFAFVVVWAMEFLTAPVYLIPGFLFDETLGTFIFLLTLLAEFGIFALCFLALWAGVEWMRYVAAIGFLLLGLANFIISIMLGVPGGVQLAVAAVFLISACILVASHSVDKYVEERRQKGVPWPALAYLLVGMMLAVAGVCGLQFLQSTWAWQEGRQQFAFANKVMQDFDRSLDAKEISRLGTETLQQSLIASDFQGQCDAARGDLGSLQRVHLPQPPAFAP